MVDITQVDRQIREGHRGMGVEARRLGRSLAHQAPKTVAAALYGGARTQSTDADAVELAGRGWRDAPFGVARAWRALRALAEDYGEPTSGLVELEEWRGNRYLNQPAWVLSAALAGAAEGLTEVP